MDDHQVYNAQQAINLEGGWMMKEKDFNFNILATYLAELMTSPWKLMSAAVNIHYLAGSDASLRLANLVKLMAP